MSLVFRRGKLIMKITKQEFEAYENIRVSGVTNMWNVDLVKDLSGLSEEKIMEIMKKYDELNKEYMIRKVGV